jgi:hypothetical protein
MLTEAEREELLDALVRWAAYMPDEPFFGFLQGRQLMRPNEIVESVKSHTAEGEAILAIFEHGVRREGLLAVLARLEGAVVESGGAPT